MSDTGSAAERRFPRIKVCGVTTLEDLAILARWGVDAVGINLVASSPRCVDRERAAVLAAEASRLGIATVAVTMNPSSHRLAEIQAIAQWDYIQLHGQERPELADDLSDTALIKAVTWSGRPEEVELIQRWGTWASQRLSPDTAADRVPLEAGHAWPVFWWTPIRQCSPVVAAKSAAGVLGPSHPAAVMPDHFGGGLGPDNVRQAIEQTHCDGVDTASGVELSPGHKVAGLVERFVAESKRGFAVVAEGGR